MAPRPPWEKITPVSTVTLHYWAGAKTAAGVESETISAGTIRAALVAASARRADARFDRVLEVCSILVNGQVLHETDLARSVDGSVDADILPPFAGGCVD